ncbi:MAG: polyprenyl synthetase family protein [Candidatus Bathyarchaeales archaeon]
MTPKPRPKPSPNMKLMEQTLLELKKRSADALEKAKKELFTIQIETQKGRDALAYYAANWDDITHPGILSLASEAVGGNHKDIKHMQIILLLLTAAVDIHDDIIDETPTKNGKRTIFGIFGKDTALLVGNAIMMKGFFLLCKYGKTLPKETLNSLIDTVQTTFFEMGNAHLLEAELKRKKEINPNAYLQIIRKKASNIEAITRIGAIIGKGTKKEVEALGRYGKILGTLITLREEFVDIFEPEELHNRMKTEYPPLPVMYLFRNPKTKTRILKLLAKKEISQDTANKIVNTVFKSSEVTKLKKEMQKMYEEALGILSEFPQKHLIPKLTLLIRSTLEDL